MSRHSPRHRPSRSRIVSYSLSSPAGDLDDAAIDRLLTAAKRDGIVTAYDSGRGGDAWWQGPPGEGMRGVTEAVRAVARKKTNV